MGVALCGFGLNGKIAKQKKTLVAIMGTNMKTQGLQIFKRLEKWPKPPRF